MKRSKAISRKIKGFGDLGLVLGLAVLFGGGGAIAGKGDIPAGISEMARISGVYIAKIMPFDTTNKSTNQTAVANTD
jgi:hypothetical protein